MKHNRFKTSLLHLAIQRAIIAVSLVTTNTILSQTVFANTAIQTAQSYHIKAGSLAQAVNQFAEQAGILLNYDARLVEGKQSQGLNGTYTLAQGFNTLLSTHGLQTQQTPNGYVLTEKPKLSSNASTEQTTSDAIQLPVINVIADSEKTEKTGRYAASVSTTALPFKASLRETPQSITVLTRQYLDDKKIDNLADAIRNTTGLSVNQYESNRGGLYARGFNIENYLIDGVPTNINEQWSAGEIFNSTAIYDRIEVIRGADGLMTGVGKPSAVVNMIRKKADSKELTGQLSIEGGSWSHMGTTTDISTPLNKSAKTRARFVVDYDTKDSYIDAFETTQQTFFATFEQDIGKNTLLSGGISYQQDETDSPTWGGIPAWTVDENINVIPLRFDRSKTVAPNWSYWDTDYTNWFVKAEHNFGDGWDASISYNNGKRNSDAKINLYYLYPIDPDTGKSAMFLKEYGMKLPVVGSSGMYDVSNEKEDLNVQINGEFDLFKRTHELSFGYNMSREKLLTHGRPGSLSAELTPDIYDFNGNMPQPIYINRSTPSINQKISQDSLFFAGRFSLLDPVKLFAGTRVVNYKFRDYKDSIATSTDNSHKFDHEFIPYLGLVWNINDHFSTYASWTSIFEPQNKEDGNGTQLKPMEGDTYEIGLKSSHFQDRLTSSLSIFRMEQDNYAERIGTRTDDNGLFKNVYRATEGAVSKGFELEIAGEILPNWHLMTGYGYFKAKEANGDDVSPLIPRKQFNLFSKYKLSGVLQNLTVGGGVRWQSKNYQWQSFAKSLGVPKLEQKAYAVVDLMAQYQIDPSWSAQLNINNVFDKKYYAVTDDGMQLYWQPSRNALLSFKYQF